MWILSFLGTSILSTFGCFGLIAKSSSTCWFLINLRRVIFLYITASLSYPYDPIEGM